MQNREGDVCCIDLEHSFLNCPHESNSVIGEQCWTALQNLAPELPTMQLSN